MKYFFSEMDEVVLTFSDIHTNRDGMEYIRIYFERPNDSGFDFWESSLPSLDIVEAAGFSEEEMTRLKDYARINAFLMWDIAREHMREGDMLAASV